MKEILGFQIDIAKALRNAGVRIKSLPRSRKRRLRIERRARLSLPKPWTLLRTYTVEDPETGLAMHMHEWLDPVAQVVHVRGEVVYGSSRARMTAFFPDALPRLVITSS